MRLDFKRKEKRTVLCGVRHVGRYCTGTWLVSGVSNLVVQDLVAQYNVESTTKQETCGSVLSTGKEAGHGRYFGLNIDQSLLVETIILRFMAKPGL